MTDRLSALLHDGADTVDVPPMPDIVASGRREVRRRRTRTALVGAVAAVLVVAGATVAVDHWRGDDDMVQPAGPVLDQGWAVASGSTVQLSDGSVVELGDGPVGYLFSTSAGVLVNYGGTAAPWGSTKRWTLIATDGTTTDFRLDIGDQLIGTDPEQPYLVYVEPTDSPTAWDLVVRDLRTGQVADTIRFEGAAGWTGNATPDAYLVGDQVYVNTDSAALVVDLTTGRATPVDALPAAQPLTIEGDLAIVEGDMNADLSSEATVVDVRTGDSLMEYTQGERYLQLSPDGRHVAALPRRLCDESGVCAFEQATGYLYDTVTGERVEVDVEGASAGWTRGGALLLVTVNDVSVCDPYTGACRSTPREIPDDDSPVLADTINW